MIRICAYGIEALLMGLCFSNLAAQDPTGEDQVQSFSADTDTPAAEVAHLAAQGPTGLDRAQSFLTDTETLTAEVNQVLISPANGVVEEKNGTLSIKRPGKFRWDYSEPYEELLVTDGETLWMYESDLDSVTKRTLDASLSNTPAALLSGTADLTALYDFVGEYRREDLLIIELKPKDTDSDFELLRVGLLQDEIRLIELKDSFDQLTRIILSGLSRNPPLEDALFDFQVPEGVDVIDDL